jgi:hypothetical protein
MKYIREFNELDPFSEEVWTDPISAKLREILIKKNTTSSIRLANLIEDVSAEAPIKLYELRSYIDGGPNDHGFFVGYVKARSRTEARAIGYLAGLHSDGVSEHSEALVQKELVDLQKRVDNIINMPTIDDYK